MTLPPVLSSFSPAASATAASTAGAAYTDIKGLQALRGDTKSPQAVARIAQQVEALFLQMMLKSMREASIGDGIFDSEEGRMYQDMFDKQVALDMSQHQHLGISDLLMRQLSQRSTDTEPLTNPAAPEFVLPGPAAPGGSSSKQRDGVTRPASDAAAASFIGQVLPAIKQAAHRIGVDPRALLAQAALETGWGQRIPRNADGSSSFNLFGIKAGSSWTGARATAVTVEFDGSVARRGRAAFRSYTSIEDSINDYAQLVSSSPRYAAALAQGSDARAFVQSLAAAGYATDPHYSRKINHLLESERLQSAFSARTAALQK